MTEKVTMTDLRILAIAALLLDLGVACAKSTPPSTGTNTNWLQHCDASAECEGASECLCGVCTISCAGSAECSPVGRDVRCAPASNAGCEDGTTGSLCLPPAPAQGADASTGASDATVANSRDAGLTLTRVGSEVQVTERYRPCGLDDDCILVGTSCNGCCAQDAIRAHDRDAYVFNHELACRDYSGPECDCAFADIVPRCVDGLCAVATPDPIRDCYSPSQNVQRANTAITNGCACEPAGLQACVDFVSLICVAVPDGARWMRIDDGACSNQPGNCPVAQRRVDADACLAEFATCIERQEGGFCGSDCRRALECTAGTCQYTPFDPAECSELGLWEGVCGDVRYRTESGGLGGPTWYWDVATGALLATLASSDFIDPTCEGRIVGGDFTVVANCEVVLDATTEICSFP
jgi:hypothetical protein